MCGINGFWNAENSQAIDRMNAAIKHRGPNGSSSESRDGVTFGHNRLSVIDLSDGGRQPMRSQDERYSIVFNGEIYNYKELRTELQGLGHEFRTDSDTEVLLAGYVAWGRELTSKMRGMWAFAIHDTEEHTVFLARDPWGIKPLYLYRSETLCAFSSEIAGLLAHPDVYKELDTISIQDLLYLGYIPSPRSILKGAMSLVPGEELLISLTDGSSTRHVRQLTTSSSVIPADAEVWDLLKTSVERHLVSDVSIGLFYSGGTDSTLIALLLKELGVPMQAYHLALEGRDDTEYARRIAETAGLTFVPVTYAPEGGLLRKAAEHMDSPTADTSYIPTLALSERAKSDVTVLLSGAGGDELFAGYNHHPRMLKHGLSKQSPALYEQLVERLVTAHAPAFSTNTLRSVGRRVESALGNAYALYAAEKAMGWGLVHEDTLLSNFSRRLTERETPDGALAFDRLMFLPDDILMSFDGATMAHGLEGRVPFLDADLFSRVGAVSNEWKRGKSGKDPLKRLLAERLGSEMAFRPKTGFSLPITTYIFGQKEDQEVARMAMRWYLETYPRMSPALDAVIRSSVGEEDLGDMRKNYPHVLYSLSLLYLFCEKHGFIDRV